MKKLADISAFEALSGTNSTSFNSVFNKGSKKRRSKKSKKESKKHTGLALLGGALGAGVGHGLIGSGLLGPAGVLGIGGGAVGGLLLARLLRKLMAHRGKVEDNVETDVIDGAVDSVEEADSGSSEIHNPLDMFHGMYGMGDLVNNTDYVLGAGSRQAIDDTQRAMDDAYRATMEANAHALWASGGAPYIGF